MSSPRRAGARPPASRSSDVVFVRGIEFEASHGTTAAERRGTRRFRCSLELRGDLSRAARSDRLADTIDYHALCALVVDIGTTRTFRLVERLAGAIADAIEERHPGLGLVVTVEKCAPPCPGAPAVAGITLSRTPGERSR